ncbi:MAG: OmpA family protein [Bacteroidia bacterium]|nr:OmpA family protein [Bacteroidia bacterium]
MKKISLFFLFALTLFCFQPGLAATKKEKSASPKGDKAFTEARYYDAVNSYKKAFTKSKKAPTQAQAAYQAGECYRMMSNWKSAEEWYGKAVQAKSKNPLATLRYADALRANGKYDEATAQYNAYKTLAPSDPAGEMGVQSSATAQGFKDKPTRHRIENATALNTVYHDFGTAISKSDKNTVYFTSSRVEASGKDNDPWYGEKRFDIFKSTRDNNGRWSTPIALGDIVNGEWSDGSICLDVTGQTMYITRVEKVKGKDGVGKIHSSTFANGKWGDLVAMPWNSDDYSVGQPTVSADGTTMYFTSDMPGGQGGKDIWMSRNEGGVWGQPVNMGTSINSAGDEMFPSVTEGGKLYYSSNGLPGMGGLDLFSTTMEGGSWSAPKNLASPMNSGGDDFAIALLGTDSGFFSSNREGGQGADDIYMFVKPPLVFVVSGKVYDTDTKEAIEGATVELFGSDGTSLSVKTGKDGMYSYPLKENTSYKLSASYTGYLTKFHELSTTGVEDDKAFSKDFDFPLKSTARPIDLPEVFYDLNKATLRPESSTALDGLVKTLDENPTITILITANTDFRADDKYNKNLSDRRAKSVYDYLIKKGVPADRLQSEGKGESEPKVIGKDFADYPPFKEGDVLTEEFIKKLSPEDFEKANQYNRRTDFRVLRTDYVPH